VRESKRVTSFHLYNFIHTGSYTGIALASADMDISALEQGMLSSTFEVISNLLQRDSGNNRNLLLPELMA
jgi:hypothetical protein